MLLYEELCWDHDDELVCSNRVHDRQRQNYYLQQNTGTRKMNQNAERINGWAAMIGVIAAMGSYAVTGQLIPGVW